MAGFRSAGRPRQPPPTPSGNPGGDASRFAAANLPPYRAQDAARPQRTEPELDLSPEALAAKAAAAHYDALYGGGPQTPARRRSPLLIMSLVFAVGAGAGLAGSKWFASTPKNPPLSASALALSAPAATVVDPDGEERALRGIRPSELPYDGKAPAGEVEGGQREARAERPDPAPAGAPTAAAVPESKPAPPEPKAAVAEAAPARAEPKAAAPEPKPAVPEQKLAARESRPEPVREQSRARQADPAEAGETAAPARETRRAETPRKAATPTRTAKAGTENAGEVERMRRQADEELNKKTAVASSPPRRGGDNSRLQQVSSALASCDRRANIILREHCRWQVCNGMWGKNGCPSYASARRDPYAY